MNDAPQPAARSQMRYMVSALRSRAARARDLARMGPSSLIVRSPNVAREIRSVNAGLDAFKATDGAQPSVDWTLRRNTHRLEKGIISRPRRKVFATSYIKETVDHFALAVPGRKLSAADNPELAWAHDVLNEYFGIVTSSPEIDRARATFEALEVERPAGEQRLTPYARDLSTDPPVEYEDLRRLAVLRRSVRWFHDRPVPRSLLDAAIEVAAQSPSACNRQPFEFFIYDEPEDVARVASVPGGTVGFSHNFPVIVAVVGKLNAFFSDRDRHLIYIDGSLAAMSFMFALETLGLSTCAIHTPGVEHLERNLAEELGLAEYERPVMLIAVGYPDPTGMVPRSRKKALDTLRRYNP